MITELSTQNFKSWKDTGKLQIAPLTGFFGANSSGKTSLLQTLLMLKQTVERPSDWNGIIDFGDDASPVNLGSFDELIHQHKRDIPLQISISWKFSEELSIAEIDGINTLSFDLSIFDNAHSVPTGSFGYKVGGQSFMVNWSSQDVQLISFPVKLAYHDESRFRCYGIRSAHYLNQERFSLFQTRFENLFRSICYLGPLREYPRRHYAWQGKHSPGVGQHGEDMVTALFSGRIQLRDTEEQIPKWLQRLDLIDSYRLNPISGSEKDYEFLVRKYKDGPRSPTHRCRFWCFTGTAGADSLLLRA